MAKAAQSAKGGADGLPADLLSGSGPPNRTRGGINQLSG